MRPAHFRAIYSILIVLSSVAATAGTAFGPEIPLTVSAPANGTQDQPQMAWPAAGPLLLWREQGTRIGAPLGATSLADGQIAVLDTEPFRDAAVATTAAGGYAAWVQSDWVYGTTLAANGSPVGRPVLLYVVDSRETSRFGAAASSNQYVVAYNYGTGVVMTFVNAGGQPLSGPIVNGTAGNYAEKVAVASDGSEFLVVWETTTAEPWMTSCDLSCPNASRQIHSISVSASGSARPQTEMVLATDAAMPDVAWNGSEYVVVWRQMPDGGIGMRTVARGGATAGTPRTLIGGNEIAPRLVSDGASLVLGTIRMPEQALIVRRLTAGGAVTEAIASGVTGASPRQYAISARDGQVALAYTSAGRIVVRRSTTVDERPARSRAVRH